MSSDGPSLGDRLRSGFLGRSRAETTATAPANQGGASGGASGAAARAKLGPLSQAAVVHIDELNAQISTLTTSERNLKDQVEKLSVQKTLLENLVDRIGDGDDSSALLKEEVLKLQQETASQQLKIKELSGQFEKAEKGRVDAERTLAAFSSGVENANKELLASEQECRRLQAEASKNAEARQLADRLQIELQSSQATVESLMTRIGRMDNDKEAMKAEISSLKEQLNNFQAQQAQQAQQNTQAQAQAQAVANSALVQEQYQELLKMKTELQSVTNQHRDATEKVFRLEQQLKEVQDLAAEKIRQLQEDVTHLRETSGAESTQQKSEIARLTQELEQTTTDLKSTQEVLQAREAELELVKGDLENERSKHEETKIGSQEALEAAKRQVDDLEASHVEAQEELRQLKEKLEATEVKAEAEFRTRKMLKQECERLVDVNQELESRLADLEGEQNLKMKQKTNLIKDLQQQLVQLENDLEAARADAEDYKRQIVVAEAAAAAAASRPAPANNSRQSQSPRGSGSAPQSGAPAHRPVVPPIGGFPKSGAPPSASAYVDPNAGSGAAGSSADLVQLTKENDELIARVAALQEKIWAIEGTKTTYEQEFERLNKELEKKTAIVQAFFAEAATKQGSKSFASSLFGPKPSEVNAQMQSMLESTLAENLVIQAKLREANAALVRTMDALRVAESQGFVRVVEEGEPLQEGEEEFQDDVFD